MAMIDSEDRIYLTTPHAGPSGYPIPREILDEQATLESTLREKGIDPASEGGQRLLRFYGESAVAEFYYDILDSTM